MTTKKTADMNLTKKQRLIPHTYAILFVIMILAAAASYIIPAGEFERIEEGGRTIVVQGSYAEIEQHPVAPFELFKAIPEGMSAASQIIFYIFLVGGAFGIIQKTGAIEAGVGKAVHKLENKEKLLIPIVMILFSILGATIGMSEESIIFVPIGIAVARAMGFDAITGTAMVSLGAAAGFTGGMFNPFTVGIAQSIAEVQLFSGLGFRFVVYLFILSFAIWYVMHYAIKVKKDPTKSIIYDIEQKAKTESAAKHLEDFQKFNWRHTLIFIFLAGGLAINVYGVFKWEWFLSELTATFIIIGFLSGIVGKLGINGTFDAFVDGMKAIAFGALIVGFARAILVIMEQGYIIDTIVNAMASLISTLPQSLNAIGMYFVQVITSIFIPSGSGMAATTMPIMTPLADLLGMERQVAVLAYQYGDAITNSIIPTSASLMAYLAVAGIPYDRWVKFVWKLIVGWLIIALIAMVVAVMIGVS
jgi:uncharacterized ion transporter superfamily protein YfcC